MFGFSLSKLLFTGLAIIVILYGFRFLNRLRERKLHNTDKGSARGEKHTSPVETMTQCSVCRVWVAADGHACGKDNCPYPSS